MHLGGATERGGVAGFVRQCRIAVPTMSSVDPITLEVIRNGLSSIADEMALIIMRSAYSPVVRDIMDYSTALCDEMAASSPRG